MVLSTTEDKLSRDLEVDRQVSFGSLCQRRLGLGRVLPMCLELWIIGGVKTVVVAWPCRNVC